MIIWFKKKKIYKIYYKDPNSRKPTTINFSEVFHTLRSLFRTLRLLISAVKIQVTIKKNNKKIVQIAFQEEFASGNNLLLRLTRRGCCTAGEEYIE